MTTPSGGAGHDKCGGRLRDGSGRTCTRPAGWGTGHSGYGACKLHGGSTPTHVVAARRVGAEEACRKFGVPVVVSAEDALLDELAMAYGTVQFYRALVQALTPEQMHQGAVRAQQTRRQGTEARGRVDITETTTVSEGRKHVLVLLLQDAQAHLLAVASTCARLGIEMRKLQMAQEWHDQQVWMITETLRTATADLPAEYQQQVMATIPGAVKSVQSEAARRDR